jgi:FOG: Ankyrin repeat
LQLALHSRRKEVTKVLLDKGANPNSANNHRQTALHRAICQSLEVNVIEQLLEAGADVNVRDSEGRSALWYACVEWSQQVIDLLLEKGADIESIRERDRVGNTILHAIITSKAPKIDQAQFLIQHNIDLNAKDDKGRSALWYALVKPYR